MKSLYENYDKINKIINLAMYHPKERVRKKNKNRIRKNYIRYRLPETYRAIYGKDILRERIRHTLAEAMKTKLINYTPYSISMPLSNSLRTPLDTMIEYSRLRLGNNFIPTKLKVNERLPDYETTKQRIINERNNVLNE